MMQNISGQEIDYDLFKMEFDSNPQIKNLVNRFDGQGVEIKTKEKSPPTEFGKKPGIDMGAAKSAAKNVMSQPG